MLENFNKKIAKSAGLPSVDIPTANIRNRSSLKDAFTGPYDPTETDGDTLLELLKNKIEKLVEQFKQMEVSLRRRELALQQREDYRIQDLRKSLKLEIP